MRKRIVKRGEKIYSCAGMRLVRYAFMAMCVMVMSSCHSNDAAMSGEQPNSWNAYCDRYHVDPNNLTEEQETYYLDCYSGSMEEDEDMSRKGGIVQFSSKCVAEVLVDSVPNNYAFIVYNDKHQNLDNELLKVDMETADMLIAAMNSAHGGKLTGYLVYNDKTGMYNYNHEVR